MSVFIPPRPVWHYPPALTDSHRAYLRTEGALLPTWDCIAGFIQRFHLTSDEAAQLIAAWIRESC